MEQKNAITTKKFFDIAKIEDHKNMGKQLMQYIKENDLSMKIQGRNYLLVDGWKELGRIAGLVARIESVEESFSEVDSFVSRDGKMVPSGKKKIYSYHAIAKIHTMSNLVSGNHECFLQTGSGICSSDEEKKTTHNKHQLQSMAMTRAISNAFKNLLSPIVKLGGGTDIETTDAEEMVVPEKESDKEVEGNDTINIAEEIK